MVAALPRGSAMILRHYDAPDRSELAFDLARLRRHYGFRLLIGADWRLACAVGADGVHLPERQAHHARACRRRSSWLVTVAAHSQGAVQRAQTAGADAVLLSPVFATASHPGATTLGPVRFARITNHCSVAVYALGGIDATNARRLVGAVGIAGISGVGRPPRAFQAQSSGAHSR